MLGRWRQKDSKSSLASQSRKSESFGFSETLSQKYGGKIMKQAHLTNFWPDHAYVYTNTNTCIHYSYIYLICIGACAHVCTHTYALTNLKN